MGDTWITDMGDLTHVHDPADVPGPARRLAEYLGRIVQAASAWYVGQPLESVIRCRRRPGRRPCPGHVCLARTQDREIIWHCVACGDNGVIRGWEGTLWDLSAPERVAEFVAVVPAEVYEAVAQSSALPRLALRVVMRAGLDRGGVVLNGTYAEFDELTAAIRVEVPRARGRRRRLLEDLVDQLETGDREIERGEVREDPTPGPREKISETLLSFALPVVVSLGADPPLDVLENALKIVVTVWNALVIKAWGKDGDYLGQARRALATDQPQFMPIFETLVKRKKRYFGTDLRAIGDFKVTRAPDGEFKVHAEARMPKSLRTIQ